MTATIQDSGQAALPGFEVIPRKIGVVDREKGIIYGVKVLGWYSNNPGYAIGADSEKPYRYTREAVINAAPLYQRALCNADHRANKIDPETGQRMSVKAPRKAEDRLGLFCDPFIIDDPISGGLHADLYYLRSHPIAERLCECVERGLHDLYCMSHDVEMLYTTREDGEVEIIAIERVKSVDLIAERGGTNSSLFESAYEAGEVMDPEKTDTQESQAACAEEKCSDETGMADSGNAQEMLDPLAGTTPAESPQISPLSLLQQAIDALTQTLATQTQAIADITNRLGQVESKVAPQLPGETSDTESESSTETESDPAESQEAPESEVPTEEAPVAQAPADPNAQEKPAQEFPSKKKDDAQESSVDVFRVAEHLEKGGVTITVSRLRSLAELWGTDAPNIKFAAACESLMESWKGQGSVKQIPVGTSVTRPVILQSEATESETEQPKKPAPLEYGIGTTIKQTPLRDAGFGDFTT